MVRSATFHDFAVMPAVQHRLVSWRSSLHRRMFGNKLPRTIPLGSEIDPEACRRSWQSRIASSTTRRPRRPPPDDEDEDDDELDLEDDEEDEDLLPLRQRKPPAHWRRSMRSSNRFWSTTKK